MEKDIVVNSEKGLRMFVYDLVPMCDGAGCPAYGECCYEKDGDKKCGFVGAYLRELYNVVVSDLKGKIGYSQLFRVGVLMFPLYRNLSRFKLVEIGIKNNEIVMQDKKGKPYVNPIYKQMNETIQLIEKTWKSIGLDAGKQTVNYYDVMENNL